MELEDCQIFEVSFAQKIHTWILHVKGVDGKESGQFVQTHLVDGEIITPTECPRPKKKSI